jgi:hypothetical protein
MITRMEESLAAFRDEAKKNPQPEEAHSLRESAVSTRGAGCRDQNTSGTERKERFFS